jgi:hypothetical protein
MNWLQLLGLAAFGIGMYGVGWANGVLHGRREVREEMERGDDPL